MTLTATQSLRRARGIGASDAPTICGVNKFQTPVDLWLKLTGQVVLPDISEEEAVEIGNAVEDGIGKLAAKRLNCKVVRPRSTFVKGIQRANVDFMLLNDRKGSDILEAKSTGLAAEWGEPGTNQIPDRVLIQVTQQMDCAESGRAHVARLSGHYGLKFDLFRVEFNARLAMAIAEKVAQFWQHVKAGTKPEGFALLEVAKLIGHTPGKHISIPATLAIEFDEARAAAKVATEAEKKSKAALLVAMGDAETADAGEFKIVKSSYKRDGYTVEPTTVTHVTVKAARAAKGK